MRSNWNTLVRPVLPCGPQYGAPRIVRCRVRAGGTTLAELMVALAVGLGIVLMAGRLLVLANGAYAAQVESSAVDDGGRVAIDVIRRAVHQAAAVDIDAFAGAAADTAPARLAGLDARTLARATPNIADPLPGAVNGSDVLAIRFPGAGAGPAGDGSVVDCAGFPVAAGEDGWSIFYVARNTEGEAELRCKYRGAHWSADALVSGVDGFQVLYGVDTDDPPDGAPNRYMNAAAVDALDDALAGSNEADFNRRTHWKRVVAVRVGLLLHGSRPTRSEPGSAHHDLLGAAYAQAAGADDPGSSLDEARMSPDLRRRERRLFTFTVALPGPPS